MSYSFGVLSRRCCFSVAPKIILLLYQILKMILCRTHPLIFSINVIVT